MNETTQHNDQDKIEEIRAEFPVLKNIAYLNTGTCGPLPQRTANVIAGRIQNQVLEGRADLPAYTREYVPLVKNLRESFARLLGAQRQEIALTHHTTEGINIIAWGIDWRPGDEIVTTTGEYSGGLLPIYSVAKRFGLTINAVNVTATDNIVDSVVNKLTRRTRLVLLSHISYQDGMILPVKEISETAHLAGALVAVDGAQAAGVIPLNMRELDVDFYALPGQKWLCGPEGVGALYVKQESLGELTPAFVGFFSLQNPYAWDLAGNFTVANDARRFEVGTPSRPDLHGMCESLSWLEERIGYEWLYKRIDIMTKQCRYALKEIPGVTILSPEKHQGLTAFRPADHDIERVAAFLAERGVVVRTLHKPDCLRVSTGFFNNEEDIRRLCDGLRELI